MYCVARGWGVRSAVASREVWSVFGWCAVRRQGFFHKDRSRQGFWAVTRRSRGAPSQRRAPGGAGCGELRANHPLSRAIEAVRYTDRQWVHVAAVLIGSTIAGAEGDGWALPLMGSAGSVLVVLTLLLAARRQRERDGAIGSILDGRELVPIAPVERQRRRLLSDRTRRGLASSLEEKLFQASGGRSLGPRFIQVPCDRLVVSQVADEITEVVGLLRRPSVSSRGVARAERLVERALSPLYGRDVDALREEFWCVRDLLGNGAGAVSVLSIETAQPAGDD